MTGDPSPTSWVLDSLMRPAGASLTPTPPNFTGGPSGVILAHCLLI